MRLLLYTHAFLWFIMGDPRTSTSAHSLIKDPKHEKLLSIASLWEIAIKVSIGKLSLATSFNTLIPQEITQAGFLILPIELSHTFTVSTLAHHHRDPIDRMLIAQALTEEIPVLSADRAFDPYGVTRLW